MFSCHLNVGSTAVRLIAALLILPGIWLAAVCSGGGPAWFWGGLSLVVLLLIGQPGVYEELAGLAARYLGNPWLWLSLALVVNGLVLFCQLTVAVLSASLSS